VTDKRKPLPDLTPDFRCSAQADDAQQVFLLMLPKRAVVNTANHASLMTGVFRPAKGPAEPPIRFCSMVLRSPRGKLQAL